jgi:CysZ protein
MLDAAFKALGQMFTRPFRSVLWKSIGLALILIVVIGIGLHRALVWLVTIGEGWAEQTFGVTTNLPVTALVWLLSFATGLGIIAGSVFLMPAVTALVASLFVDDIGAVVERTHYPGDSPGTELPLWRALFEGIKTALLAVAVYLVALPFLLFAGFGAVIFFLATAFLLGREYFILAAMRFRSPAEAKRLRREFQGTVFIAGLFIAAFVSIPILNLATPLFGMAFMVHMHKRLTGTRPALIEHEPASDRHRP